MRQKEVSELVRSPKYLSYRPTKVTRHMSSHEYLWLQCDTFTDYGTDIDGAKTLGQKPKAVKNCFCYHCEHEMGKEERYKYLCAGTICVCVLGLVSGNEAIFYEYCITHSAWVITNQYRVDRNEKVTTNQKEMAKSMGETVR